MKSRAPFSEGLAYFASYLDSSSATAQALSPRDEEFISSKTARMAQESEMKPLLFLLIPEPCGSKSRKLLFVSLLLMTALANHAHISAMP